MPEIRCYKAGDIFKRDQNTKSLYIFSLMTPRRRNGKESAILKTFTEIYPAPMIISIDWRRKIRIEKNKMEVFDVIFVRRTGFVRIANRIKYISIKKP